MDMAVDPRGNYAIDTLLFLLQSRTNQNITRWSQDHQIQSPVLLAGSGDHWQAILRDKNKHWFCLERKHKFPIQDLRQFLMSKLLNGAVYQIGMMDELPNPDYMHVSTQLDSVLTTRTHDGEEPPRKRQTRELNFRLAKPKPKASINYTPIRSPMPLPSDFEVNPQFNFIPPTNEVFPAASDSQVSNVEPTQFLFDLMTPEVCPNQDMDDTSVIEESEEVNTRPQRSRSKTTWYQAD